MLLHIPRLRGHPHAVISAAVVAVTPATSPSCADAGAPSFGPHPQALVRIGGGSQEEKLKAYNMNVYTREEVSQTTKSYEAFLRKALEGNVCLQRQLGEQLAVLEAGLLTPSTVLRSLTPQQVHTFGPCTQSTVDAWRGACACGAVVAVGLWWQSARFRPLLSAPPPPDPSDAKSVCT